MKTTSIRSTDDRAQRLDARTCSWRGLLAAGLLAVAMALPAAALAAAVLIDLNAAPAEQLAELPGIGPAKAQAIIDERSRRPFASVDDLERVKGIGQHVIAGLRDRVEASDPPGN